MSTPAPKYSIGFEELQSKEHLLWKSILAEFLGNFILNFFAIGACTQPEDGTFKAFSFGFSIYMGITIVGYLSGGHINPAVSVAMALAGRISLIRMLLYIVAQCMGSAAGTCVLKNLLDEAYHNGLGHTTLAENISELQGLGIEFILGLLLVLTVFGACDAAKPDNKFIAPFSIGMAVTLGHLGTIRYTGTGMNPARAFGTAFATDNWQSHWVYWAGPILGGIVACMIYSQILEKPTVPPKPIEASDKYRIHAYEREMKKLEISRDFA
ncbi:aquaporin AQPAn.G-like [Musca vetustissima]|uniref:aquaporin AQPAn.G-like n=1 Tax=Musca vetustissima TaxID=27455 RepID=UPI002AB64076|nr:aquaporin AQPAn.G-like [Musca vetustissima]